MAITGSRKPGWMDILTPDEVAEWDTYILSDPEVAPYIHVAT